MRAVSGGLRGDGPGLGWMLVSGGDVVPRRRRCVLDTEFSDFRAMGPLEKGLCCRQGKTALSTVFARNEDRG